MMRESLGISEDLHPFYRLLRKDRLLRPLVRRLYGMREGWGMNIFSSLTLASVLLQMAPIKRSQDMWDCLLNSYGRRIRFDGKSVLFWPKSSAFPWSDPEGIPGNMMIASGV